MAKKHKGSSYPWEDDRDTRYPDDPFKLDDIVWGATVVPPKKGRPLAKSFADEKGDGGFQGDGAPPWKGKAWKPMPMTPSYGCVVIDDSGLILLRAPKNFFGGYAWTHAKGGQDAGEDPADTAAREALEETGYLVHVVQEIPKDYPGTTTTTRYYLGRPQERVQDPDHETYRVGWFTLDQARERIADTQNKKGRERDLDVLDLAWQLWTATRGGVKNPGTRMRKLPLPPYPRRSSR